MYNALVCGDFHIDTKYDIEQINRLLTIVAEEANKRDELIILGDVFNKNRVSAEELICFISFIKKVKVPIILLGGNHDTEAGKTVLDWVPLLFNLTYSRSSLSIVREGISILLAHCNVQESIMGAADFKLGTGVSINDIQEQLALLGHIHLGQNIQGTHCLGVHPGSLFYTDFGERNDPKALVALTLDSGRYKIERLPINPDPIVQLDVYPDTEAEVLANYPKECRVKLIVHYSDPLLRKLDIIKKYDKYSFRDKKISFIYEPKAKEVTSYSTSAQSFEEFLQSNSLDAGVLQLLMEVLKDASTGA